MVESRWLRWIGPGVVAIGAVGFIASTTLGAGIRPWTPIACAGPPTERIAAARGRVVTAPADLRGAPWFRLDPVLDGEGALTGQGLVLGLDGERNARSMDLAAEAFAAGPFGALVLVGWDDGFISRVQAIDVARGCAWPVADERDVIRRATIDPTGRFIYEMRVDRATRADLGIWRRPIDGVAAARQVLGSPPPDDRFGRTFSTEFSWDVAGERLAIQSCGEHACRFRVITPGGGPAVTLDSPDLGQIVGLAGDLAVTYGACRGLPCPIVATDLRTGDRRVLAPLGRPCRRDPDRGRPPARPRGRRRDRTTIAVRHARRPRPARSRTDPRRPSAPPIGRARRRSHEPAARLDPARTRWPSSGRRPPPIARSSATSRMAQPSRSMRPCDDHRQATPAPRHRDCRHSPLDMSPGGRRDRARPGPRFERRSRSVRTRSSASAGVPVRSRPRSSRKRSRMPPTTRTTPARRRRRRSTSIKAARPGSAMERVRPAVSTVWRASRGTSRTASRCGFASRATSSIGER